jgi:CIC family chloride channel protein
VTVDTTERSDLLRIAEEFPYHHFPLVRENRLLGLIARRSIVDGTGTAVEPIPADTITPSETVREAAQKLVISSSNLLLLISDNQQVPIALVTLHDVLRAQARITEQILSQSFFALPG